MKLRINGNSIRLRLSQTEVKQFGETEICFDTLSFGETQFTYQLHMAEVDEIWAEFVNNTLSIEVPYELGEKWVQDTEMVGFNHSQNLDNGDKITILVEKDFKCLTKRVNEDESDNFPNPDAENLIC